MAVYKFMLYETYSKMIEVEADSENEAFEALDVKVSCGDENAVDLGNAIGGYEYSIEPLAQMEV